MVASLREALRSPLDGGYNSRITSAAADIAVHVFDNLMIAGLSVISKKRSSRHDHARGAVAALQCFFIKKRLLHCTQISIALQTFDSRDLRSCHRSRFCLTGPSRSTIDEHSAGTALSLAAPVLRAGKLKAIAQN
jgi:hypothetical protein